MSALCQKRTHALQQFCNDWVVHDLRRAVRTGIDQLGTPPHICEAVLNHLPPKLVRTYNLNTYENEKRKALSAWRII